MTQMVRQAVDTAGPDVSVNRDKGDDRSGTDFLRMLRGRQQALDRRETEERLSKKEETRDKPGPADKKDNDAGEPVSGRIPLEAVKADTGDVLKDFTFQFRMDPGQLPEQWDAAVSDAQGSGLWVQVQAPAVREDAADALGQEAGAAGEWGFWSGNPWGYGADGFGCRCKSRRTDGRFIQGIGKRRGVSCTYGRKKP